MREPTFVSAVAATAVIVGAQAVAAENVNVVAEYQYTYSQVDRDQPKLSKKVSGDKDQLQQFDLLPGDRLVISVEPNMKSLRGRECTSTFQYRKKKGKKKSNADEFYSRPTTAEWPTHFYPKAVVPAPPGEDKKGQLTLDSTKPVEVVLTEAGKMTFRQLWHSKPHLLLDGAGESATDEERAEYDRRANELTHSPGFDGWRVSPSSNSLQVVPGTDANKLQVTVTVKVYRAGIAPAKGK